MTEVKLARECEKHEPGYLRDCADSYGEVDAFDQWESQHKGENYHA